MQLKMSSGIWLPFYPGLDVLKTLANRDRHSHYEHKTVVKYSVSPIYRGRVYRGIGYIAVACWTPFFCPPISRILQTWCPRAQYFRVIAVTPCIQFAGDNFSRNLLTAIAFVPVRWRQFFAKSTRAYLSMRAGTHAVRWAATLGGALTPPLCRRVGSS